MTTYQWLTLAQFILMAAASIIVWVLGRERKELDRQIEEVNKRLDAAGSESSDLASAVQGILIDVAQMPAELAKTFVTKERFEDSMIEGRRDREGLWREVGVLRSILDRRGRREDSRS
jgi:hypothetical protein